MSPPSVERIYSFRRVKAPIPIPGSVGCRSLAFYAGGPLVFGYSKRPVCAQVLEILVTLFVISLLLLARVRGALVLKPLYWL